MRLSGGMLRYNILQQMTNTLLMPLFNKDSANDTRLTHTPF